jgi:excinuclease ABC subunit A
MKYLIIKGAKEHNLKNIDLKLPKESLIVFTGISGSGKSSLALDTIFAEGQRRYLESLSSYARQFLGQLQKPNVEKISGLSPSICISQKAPSHNPRSTVGTITEIYDYLRLLFSKIGQPHCPDCNRALSKMSLEEMVDKILELPQGEKIEIFAPVVRGRKGEYLQFLNDLYLKGYSKVRINGKEHDLSKRVKLPRYKTHEIEVFIDELKIKAENISRIFEALEQAVNLTEGIVKIKSKMQETLFNQHLACPYCAKAFPTLEPRLFSFNSPYGACTFCGGMGEMKELDPDLIIPDKTKTIAEGGILPYSYTPKNYYGAILEAVCQNYGISSHRRIKDLSKKDINLILYGPEIPERLRVRFYFHGQPRSFWLYFEGLIPELKKRWEKTESSSVREEIEKYMSSNVCPSCKGARLKKEALMVRIQEKNIAQISSFSIKEALNFFEILKLSPRQNLIAGRILKEVKARLKFLIGVGLDYLTLARSANTLAAGEAQRIRLASQLGSELTGVLYILDEPSVGLHMRDNKKLLETLKNLRDLGNTIIVIEHDEATIRAADYLVDLGPGAGKEGGKIVAQGTFKDIISKKASVTGAYLRGEKKIPLPKERRKIKDKSLILRGCSEHNLKNITVGIPLGVFLCVTGVSGSGKSTLINDILYKALARKLHRSLEKPGKYQSLEGTHFINKVIIIDQSPIGRTPRSNPVTYTGVFRFIREIFAQTEEAKIRGYSPSRFSFNLPYGRCERCAGEGFLKIEMQFLPDVYLPCEVCKGKRYANETLEVKFKNKNIAQVLEMSIREALEFFKDIPQIKDPLKIISDIGLDYIELGQPATTLSGGEAQRIKLASELIRPQRGKTLYILDEPTTGLHFDDIKKLLEILQKLVDQGNTVLVIEHNLEVIKQADWIIDLGPEGGEKGGQIVVQGRPEEIVKCKASYTGLFLKPLLNNK